MPSDGSDNDFRRVLYGMVARCGGCCLGVGAVKELPDRQMRTGREGCLWSDVCCE